MTRKELKKKIRKAGKCLFFSFNGENPSGKETYEMILVFNAFN